MSKDRIFHSATRKDFDEMIADLQRVENRARELMLPISSRAIRRAFGAMAYEYTGDLTAATKASTQDIV